MTRPSLLNSFQQAHTVYKNQPNKSVVLVFSGGQDSTTCLAWLLAHDFAVYCVTFDYGQKHSREIMCAKSIVEYLQERPTAYSGIIVNHEIIPLPVGILKGASPLVNPDSPLEQYEGPDALPGGIEKTFVPCRNQLFTTIAANRAASVGATMVMLGVCEADYGGYPDCRFDFLKGLANTLNAGTFTGEAGAFPALTIAAPLLDMKKADAVWLMRDLGMLNLLAMTQTGYDGAFPPNGNDHATLLRAKGFIEAGIPDPLVLKAWTLGLMDLPDTANYGLVQGHIPSEIKDI